MGKEVDDAMDVEKTTTGDDDNSKDKKADEGVAKKKASSSTPSPPPPPPPVRDLLLQAAAALDKAAANRDVRALPARALRLFAAARARVTGADVLAFAREVLLSSSKAAVPSTTGSDALGEIESALKQVCFSFFLPFVSSKQQVSGDEAIKEKKRRGGDRKEQQEKKKKKKKKKRWLFLFFFSIARIGDRIDPDNDMTSTSMSTTTTTSRFFRFSPFSTTKK